MTISTCQRLIIFFSLKAVMDFKGKEVFPRRKYGRNSAEIEGAV
jgi:hypothetical protein